MSYTLPITAEQLPEGVCSKIITEQDRLNLFAAYSRVVVPGLTGRVVWSSTPPIYDPTDPVYWVKMSNGYPLRAYTYVNGAWVARHSLDPGERKMAPMGFDLASIATYDGGDSDAPGIMSGPMWEECAELRCRFPIGAGTFPAPSTTVLTEGGTGGEETHLLTEAEGSVSQHTHPIGWMQPGSDDIHFPTLGQQTVATYAGAKILGSYGSALPVDDMTVVNLFSLTSNNGVGLTAVGHNNMPPYLVVYFLRRTDRCFYKE